MDLVSFEDSYVQTQDDLKCGNPDAFACIAIDGFPANEYAEGRVVCEVWMTMRKDVIVSWHDNGYRMDRGVLDLIDAARDRLSAMWNEAHYA